MVLLILAYLISHHTMAMAQTQNISFTPSKGCLNQKPFFFLIGIHFNSRHMYAT